MKILHWSIILIAIILPFSIVCRNTVNSRFTALKDEVRLNNAIDTATKDAIDQIIAVSGFEFDNEFGDVINITPALAQETINTFFHTLAINYNIPYKISDSTAEGANSSDSYIKNYFSPFVPAVVILAYDGFYIYSQENSNGGYRYELSTKIPYTESVTISDGVHTYNYSIGYTLGEDIYVYANEKCFSGRLYYNSFEEIENEYNTNYASFATSVDDVASVTNDISMILYYLQYKESMPVNKMKFKDNILPNASDTNFLQDYIKDNTNKYTVGKFHENRRKVIIDIISECLTQEINVEHNRFADMVGNTYDFALPEITEDDWINTINDISVMAFVQGIPIGSANGQYFNSYALGGSQIVTRDYLYGKKYDESGHYLYHRPGCSLLDDNPDTDVNVTDIFITEEDAISNVDPEYYPCQLCN